MSNFEGFQLLCVPDFSMGIVHPIEKYFIKRIKRMLAAPWNLHVKKWLKQAYYMSIRWRDEQPPQTTERWQYVYRSLLMSREIDKEHSDDAED